MEECPVCQQQQPKYKLEQHVNECLDRQYMDHGQQQQQQEDSEGKLCWSALSYSATKCRYRPCLCIDVCPTTLILYTTFPFSYCTMYILYIHKCIKFLLFFKI